VLRFIFTIILASLFQLSLAQANRVKRIVRNSDTCRALQIIGKINSLSEQNRLMLLDNYSCIKEEKITLRKGLNWISFPRLEKKYVVINDLLGNDKIECTAPYPYGSYVTGSYLENIPVGADIFSIVVNHYNGAYWTAESGLAYVNSKFGYKLFLNTVEGRDKGNYYLKMRGRVNSFDKIDRIYADRENWVGYWLYQEQNIFDALGSYADNFSIIKHQDWVCVKGTPLKNQWYCNQKTVNVQYGDMVILSGNEEVYDFHWHLPEKKATRDSLITTKHFVFEIEKQYNPVLVELDKPGYKGELGVFEGDRCVGAAPVHPEDSVLVIPAYYHFGSADTLTFRLWNENGTERTIRRYYLFNQRKGVWKKDYAYNFRGVRTITVSFKNTRETIENKLSFKVFPGRTKDAFSIEYFSEKPENLHINLYDLTGKRIFSQTNGKQSGTRIYQLNIGRLPNGVYLIQLATENKTGTKRILINNQP